MFHKKHKKGGGNQLGKSHPWHRTMHTERELSKSEAEDAARRELNKRNKQTRYVIDDPDLFIPLTTGFENQLAMNSYADLLPDDERNWSEQILDEER